MNDNVYDYAVIGGGLTGLIVSLLLKKYSGKNVVLFEKNKIAGGLTITLPFGGYEVDSIYMFPDIKKYLKYLDIDLPFYELKKSFYKIILKDTDSLFKIELPPDENEFKNVLCEEFPEEKIKIENFIKYCNKIEKQFLNLKSKLKPFDILKMIFNSQDLLSSSMMSVSALIKKFNFKNTLLIKIFEAFAGLSILPPEKLNALIPVIAMINLLKGTYRHQNTFKEIINALIQKIKQEKVDLLFKSEVKSIIKNNGLFRITLKGGEEYYSEKVISSIDTKKMFSDVLDNKIIPAGYKSKIINLKMTQSFYILRLLLKSNEAYDTESGQILFYGGNNTFSFLYNKAINNQSILDENVFHFAITIKVTDRSKNIYMLELLSIPVSYDYWKNIFDADLVKYRNEIKIWEDFFINKLSDLFDPQIKNKIIKKRSITPVNFSKFFNLTKGNIFDMTQDNKQAGVNRLSFKTPVKNFYHCKIIHGVYGAFFQSFLISDYILNGKINNYKYKW